MAKTRAAAALSTPPTPGQVVHVRVGELHFDPTNPRFGNRGLEEELSQKEILRTIIEEYGVEDLLPSLAENGYFPSEPLVGQRQEGGAVTVVEGNRRLAALLILTADPRAADYANLLRRYPPKFPDELAKVPVLVLDRDAGATRMLAYLGVKHIVGAMAWDSYAKAAWVARVLDDGKATLTLGDIKAMFGESQGTLERILEAYYFVTQVHGTGKYKAEDSEKVGRGSQTGYPFSWVYNVLGYKSAREFVGLPSPKQTHPNPIPADHVENAVDLLAFMFGHKSKGLHASVPESRQLDELADCLADVGKAQLLRKVRSVDQVKRQSMAGDRLIEEALVTAKVSLSEAATALGRLTASAASKIEPLAKEVRSSAFTLHRSVLDRMAGDDDGE